MWLKIKALALSAVLSSAISVSLVNTANAGLIIFTDRDAFEEAVTSPIAFEGFNDKAQLSDDLSLSHKRFHSITSHTSEGDGSLSLFEDSTFSIEFGHDVFAIGFDVNELNVNNLSYADSAGHFILDALKVTEIWNQSTFFGVISDTAIRSFSLIGSGESNATYGFDALAYTAAPAAVAEPNIFVLFLVAILGLWMSRVKSRDTSSTQ